MTRRRKDLHRERRRRRRRSDSSSGTRATARKAGSQGEAPPKSPACASDGTSTVSARTRVTSADVEPGDGKLKAANRRRSPRSRRSDVAARPRPPRSPRRGGPARARSRNCPSRGGRGRRARELGAPARVLGHGDAHRLEVAAGEAGGLERGRGRRRTTRVRASRRRGRGQTARSAARSGKAASRRPTRGPRRGSPPPSLDQRPQAVGRFGGHCSKSLSHDEITHGWTLRPGRGGFLPLQARLQGAVRDESAVALRAASGGRKRASARSPVRGRGPSR